MNLSDREPGDYPFYQHRAWLFEKQVPEQHDGASLRNTSHSYRKSMCRRVQADSVRVKRTNYSEKWIPKGTD